MSDRHKMRAFASLQKHMNENVTMGKMLAKETTMRVGGSAEIFAVADSLEHLKVVIETVNDWGLELFVIGKGSNLLVSDYGFSGVVLRLGTDFMRKRIDGVKVQAGAAVSLPSLVQAIAKQSLDGLSFGVGIPGSVGGALRMNAGAHGSSISDVVKSVLFLTRDCRLKSLDRHEIGFGYRKADIDTRDIIVEVTLELTPGNYDTIRSRMEDYFNKRKQNQPLQYPNSGSVFKNPVGFSAGYLIERAGCKGLMIGDAQVSEKHANFIINKGHASATDVFTLIRLVQKRVFDLSGIVLEPEVEMIGEFDNALLATNS